MKKTIVAVAVVAVLGTVQANTSVTDAMKNVCTSGKCSLSRNDSNKVVTSSCTSGTCGLQGKKRGTCPCKRRHR